jgi:hypothetical protein
MRLHFLGLLSVFAFISCDVVKRPACRTECGMGVFHVQQDDCDELSKYEREAVKELTFVEPKLCERLSHFQALIWQTDGGSWVDGYGVRVAGLTYCDLLTIELGTKDWDKSAYFHEVAHVAQCPFQDYGHTGWVDAGITDALHRLHNKVISQPYNTAR